MSLGWRRAPKRVPEDVRGRIDDLVVGAIRSTGPGTTNQQVCRALDEQLVAMLPAHQECYDRERVVDASLQRLRKAGSIIRSGKGWMTIIKSTGE